MRRSQLPYSYPMKEVRVEGRRYVVCVNEDEVKKDRADRRASAHFG